MQKLHQGTIGVKHTHVHVSTQYTYARTMRMWHLVTLRIPMCVLPMEDKLLRSPLGGCAGMYHHPNFPQFLSNNRFGNSTQCTSRIHILTRARTKSSLFALSPTSRSKGGDDNQITMCTNHFVHALRESNCVLAGSCTYTMQWCACVMHNDVSSSRKHGFIIPQHSAEREVEGGFMCINPTFLK